MLYKRSSRNRCQKKSLLKLVQRLEFLPLEFTGILGIQSVVQQIFTEPLSCARHFPKHWAYSCEQIKR